MMDVEMDKAYIMVYAGQCLEKYKTIDSKILQKFIMKKEEVGKPLPIEDIEEALNLLYYANFISCIDGESYVKQI
jgi:hypothetical protein